MATDRKNNFPLSKELKTRMPFSDFSDVIAAAEGKEGKRTLRIDVFPRVFSYKAFPASHILIKSRISLYQIHVATLT